MLALILVLTSGCGGEKVAKTDEVTTTIEKMEAPDVETPKKETIQAEKEETVEKSDNEKMSADFKAAMDSYEQFFDEYVDIMKKYANNPSDLSLLTECIEYMGKYAQIMEKLEKWESEDMNADETAYYIEVQGRISKKLLEVAQ